jgi:hypothetical protein
MKKGVTVCLAVLLSLIFFTAGCESQVDKTAREKRRAAWKTEKFLKEKAEANREYKKSAEGQETLRKIKSAFYPSEEKDFGEWADLYSQTIFANAKLLGASLLKMEQGFRLAEKKDVDWVREIGISLPQARHIYRSKTIEFCRLLALCLKKSEFERARAGFIYEEARISLNFSGIEEVVDHIVWRLKEVGVTPQEAGIAVADLRQLLLADLRVRVSFLQAPNKELARRIRKYGFVESDFNEVKKNYDLYIKEA